MVHSLLLPRPGMPKLSLEIYARGGTKSKPHTKEKGRKRKRRGDATEEREEEVVIPRETRRNFSHFFKLLSV